MASTPTITLKSSDGEVFIVDEAVALESQTIRLLIEAGCFGRKIQLTSVTSNILSKVIEYCKKHAETPKTTEEGEDEVLKSWDAEFIKVLDVTTLIDLTLAANYLNIKSLLDFTCKTVADTIMVKTPEEICKTFNNQEGLYAQGRG